MEIQIRKAYHPRNEPLQVSLTAIGMVTMGTAVWGMSASMVHTTPVAFQAAMLPRPPINQVYLTVSVSVLHLTDCMCSNCSSI